MKRTFVVMVVCLAVIVFVALRFDTVGAAISPLEQVRATVTGIIGVMQHGKEIVDQRHRLHLALDPANVVPLVPAEFDQA